ncbi:homoserine kinase [Pelosinus propionicus]|uniref:Homoserine kinase n=1 Tax=Pelosinus propionicus DSM 13327 TaxID=1123291 RepID=A0A1I4H7Q2_9FIRM|nr:homoserine kinase [Pelosinus propionicus]SFL38274.1 homoserine kinase [Pelosinus propionicus DSM 13327]
MSITVKVRVPGTTANCGPGFDAVGIACTIYSELELFLSDEGTLRIEIEGEGKGRIPTDSNNIIYQAVQAVLDRVGKHYQGIYLKLYNKIPLARGLGSSAAAIVGGLIAANHATGNTLTQEEIFSMATIIEGHPDNVAPAIFGGITISVMQDTQPVHLRFMPEKMLNMVVAIPEFNLSTHTARQVLPDTITMKDAVFNISRVALLIGALCKGEFHHLQYALEDKVHQPYRQELVPGMQQVFDAAVAKGAYGAALSGAGPCLIAFTDSNCDRIGKAMVQAFSKCDVKAEYISLSIDIEGAKVIE